ncbi:lipopolysaccharide assembly protein LapA domain-containing protein [Neokomagataea anthophila]|uniref:LapA family protein n=1 Tax=Neokomagataea anthophila TaxID=2826925 RepID=A0ABS5E784_9PROT|nr:LapA family protein [Neokomagataea anthophila]MBR0559770.1 LapA family protein [Neokomagataea anthophila]
MLRILLLIIFLAPLVIFALSNPMEQDIWFFFLGWKLAIGTLALGVGLLGVFIGFVVGWIGELRQRSRARRSEQQVRSLEGQLIELHQRLDRLQQNPASPASSSTPTAKS